MFTTIINDCRDANAVNRQATRAAALFGCPVTVVGVKNDLEAAGNLVDALDAADGAEGVVLVNVAPRHGAAKKWPNGTPFGWFRVGRTLVVASIDGLTLSLVKKFGLVDGVEVMDIPTVIASMVRAGTIPLDAGNAIISTQFRSLEFLPRAARWLADGLDVPSTRMGIGEIEDAPAAVWWIDNFGNCKTTLFASELPWYFQENAFTPLTALPTYDRLKDVPDGQAAFVTGSSGHGGRRFVEIVIQGGDAASRFGLTSGLLVTRPGVARRPTPAPLPILDEVLSGAAAS